MTSEALSGKGVRQVQFCPRPLEMTRQSELTPAPSSGQRNIQVLANLACCELQNFAVAWHAGHLLFRTVHVNGVVAALAQELTAVTLQVPDKLQPFHAVPRSSGSRMTSWPRKSSSASSRLAWSTMVTASAKLARASSSVAPWVLAPGNSSTKAA